MSLATQTGFGSINNHFLSGSFQNVRISMTGGNKRAKALLAIAPISVIRSSRSGIPRARAAEQRKGRRGGGESHYNDQIPQYIIINNTVDDK